MLFLDVNQFRRPYRHIDRQAMNAKLDFRVYRVRNPANLGDDILLCLNVRNVPVT